MSRRTRLEVPLLDLKGQYAVIRDEVEEAIRRVLESQRFILGPEVEALEHEIAEYCGVPFAIGCASGSDALLLALIALGVQAEDEVLCPAYTFFSTAGSVARLGARPVFVDIDPATYNLDLESARKAAAGCTRLKALIPVDLFGQACDLESLLSLAEELDVCIVEDAAQAIGAEDAQGQRCGSRGAVGCFSFFPSKNLGGYGDGGIITTRDPELAARIRALRVHGAGPKYHHSMVGLNSRLDELQAAVLRVKLPHLGTWTAGRQANAARYDEAFRGAGARLSGEPEGTGRLRLAVPRPAQRGARHVYNQYVIRVPAAARNGLRDALLDQGIQTEIYYPLGLHEQACFSALGGARGDLRETEAAAAETLALPVYPELSPEQLEHVVRSVVAFLQSS